MLKAMVVFIAVVGALFPASVDASEPPFLAQRLMAAWEVAQETPYEWHEVLDTWKGAPLPNQKAVVAAVQQLDAEYVYASSNPDVGFDCSGLINYAWGEAGADLANNSRQQIRDTVETSRMRAGDLIWYPGHIMMYLGFDDYIIHAANRKTDVTIGQAHRIVDTGRVDMPSVGTTGGF